MAVLSASVRKKVWAGLMRYWSRKGDVMAFSKRALYDPDLNIGAIADTDLWIDTHEGNVGDVVGFNGTLQTPFKTQATGSQKTEMFAAVAMARRSEDTLREWLQDIEA